MRRILLSLVLAISACGPAIPPPQPTPDPPPSPDPPPAPPPPEASDCAPGCARLKELGCAEGKGSTPSDPDSCRKDCEYVETQGMIRINAACWKTLSSCSELNQKCSVEQ